MIFAETKRLWLRNVKSTDANIIYDYRNHPLCARYQRGQIKTLCGITELIERRKNDVISMRSPSLVAVAIKQTDELIGEINVMPQDGIITLGYTFSYKYHRQGYAFEALSTLLDMLHRQYPDSESICYTDPKNLPSIKLLKKLGYKDMGYIPAINACVFGNWMK